MPLTSVTSSVAPGARRATVNVAPSSPAHAMRMRSVNVPFETVRPVGGRIAPRVPVSARSGSATVSTPPAS